MRISISYLMRQRLFSISEVFMKLWVRFHPNGILNKIKIKTWYDEKRFSM